MTNLQKQKECSEEICCGEHTTNNSKLETMPPPPRVEVDFADETDESIVLTIARLAERAAAQFTKGGALDQRQHARRLLLQSYRHIGGDGILDDAVKALRWIESTHCDRHERLSECYHDLHLALEQAASDAADLSEEEHDRAGGYL